MTASLTIPPGSQPVADGQAIPAGAATQLYNGATWDRAYGNVQGALLASLARTASASAPLVTNPNHRGVLLFLNVTAAPPTPPAGAGLQVQLALVDPISSLALYRNPLPAKVTATGLYVYEFYPAPLTAGATQSTVAALPRTWRVDTLAGDASSFTYSIGYALIR